MKKFLITLLILIILGAVAFFFGWVQFSVPIGSFGVMQSKTHGIDPNPIVPGEFRWVWYKLIPTNVKISVFRLEPVQHSAVTSGSLPSGNVYALFAGGQIDFSWEIETSFSYTLKSSNLIPLVTENNITSQEELSVYYTGLSSEIESFMISFITSPENTEEFEQIMSGASTLMEKLIAEQFHAIGNFSYKLKIIKYPDFRLYYQVRELYEDYIGKQRDYTSSLMGEKASSRIEMMLKMDELERYGELLTKYPILLEYLSQVQN